MVYFIRSISADMNQIMNVEIFKYYDLFSFAPVEPESNDKTFYQKAKLKR